MMDIKATVVKMNNAGNLAAYATITVDGWLLIRDIRVINGSKGLFISMPSRKATDSEKAKAKIPKEYTDIAFSITKEGREAIHHAIMEELDHAQAKANLTPAQSAHSKAKADAYNTTDDNDLPF
jgi:stage V sporulation protein G